MTSDPGERLSLRHASHDRCGQWAYNGMGRGFRRAGDEREKRGPYMIIMVGAQFQQCPDGRDGGVGLPVVTSWPKQPVRRVERNGEPVDHWRTYLADPERYLRHLLR